MKSIAKREMNIVGTRPGLSKAGWVAVAAVAFCLLGSPGPERAPGGPVPEEIELQAAFGAFTNAVAISLARQQNPELLKHDASVAFLILNPKLVQPKIDPQAALGMLDPWAAEAELQKDPAFREQQKKAYAALAGASAP